MPHTVLLVINPQKEKDVYVLNHNATHALETLESHNEKYALYMDVNRDLVKRALGKLTDYQSVKVGSYQTSFLETQDDYYDEYGNVYGYAYAYSKPAPQFDYIKIQKIANGYKITPSKIVKRDDVLEVLSRWL